MFRNLLNISNDGLEILQGLNRGSYEVGAFFNDDGFEKVTIYGLAVSSNNDSEAIEVINRRVPVEDRQESPGIVCEYRMAKYKPKYITFDNTLYDTKKYSNHRKILDKELGNILIHYDELIWSDTMIHENSDDEWPSPFHIDDTPEVRTHMLVIGHKLDLFSEDLDIED